MTWDQVTGQIRQFLPIVGTLAVSLGWLKPTEAASVTDSVMAIVGALAVIASIVWSHKTNSPAAIVAKADALDDVQGVVTKRTPEGLALAQSVPSATVVASGTDAAAAVADAISRSHP